MTITRRNIALLLAVLLAATILLGVAPFAPVARAATEDTVQSSGEGVISARRVNIRPEPSTKNTPIGKARKGDVFTVTGFIIPDGFSQGFFQVEGGTIEGVGYIAANYMSVTFDAPPTGEITKKGYLYTAKSTSRKHRADVVEVGDVLPLIAREGKWWRSELNGQTVWIPIANVQEVQPPAATTEPVTPVAPAPPVVVPSTGGGYSGSTPTQYTITMEDDNNGTASANPSSVAAGTQVTITATPSNGFKFKQWVVVSGGAVISNVTANPATFNMPTGNVTIKAEFEPVPPTQVTFTAAQTGGTSNTTDSTGIVLTFDPAVTGLTANDISITDGTGTVVAGTLSGSGTTWTIALTSVTAQGNVTVSVDDFGNYNISAGPKTVAVYMSNAVANAEAAKITNFATGTNTTSSLVFDPTITDGTLTTGAVVNLVEVKAGANAGTAVPLNSSSITAAGVLSLNTQNTVDAADLTYVGVTFTVTLNGVTSDPVTLDINSLFGATTTAGKLRTDKAKFTGNGTVVVTPIFTGDAQLFNPITMSPDVAMTETAAVDDLAGGFKDATIRADVGRGVTFKLITSALVNTSARFTDIPFVCDGTTYTYTEIFFVYVHMQ